MSRLQTAYWIELDAIIDLADYGVEWDMIEKILYDIASFHGSFDEAIEHNLEKLLRQTKAAGGVRSPRRAWLRD